MQSVAQSGAYRPDIDGLRALAVLLVVFFHASPSSMPGGYAGVDIFFVISGFLITGIISGGLKNGSYTFLGFYARRCRRILPALLLVLLVSLACSWALLQPDQLADFSRNMVGASFFWSNILLWRDAGYFDAATIEKPLRHLWSLAVEEQFYLLWPVLFWWSFKRKLGVKKILAALLLLSFAANVLRIKAHPDEVFYLLPGRLWELLLGAGLSQFHSGADSCARRTLGIISFSREAAPPVLMVVFMLFFPSAPFPGWAALLPVLAALIFIQNGSGGFCNRLLSHPVPVYIGKISYPLYLWHWPLISLAYIHYNGIVFSNIQFSLVALSFLLAVLTYHFVEQPVRNRLFSSIPLPSRNALWVASGLSGLLVAGAAGWVSLAAQDSGEVRFNNDRHTYMAYQRMINTSGCFLPKHLGYDKLEQECSAVSGSGDRTVFIWGDSFAERLEQGLRIALKNDAVFVRHISSSGCSPVSGLVSSNSVCRSVNEHVLDFIRRQNPHTVILAANWTAYIQPGDIGVESFREHLAATVAGLKAAGIHQILVAGQTPIWKQYLYRVLGTRDIKRFAPDKGSFLADRILGDMAPEFGVRYVRVMPLFCNGHDCQIYVNGWRGRELLVFDATHLTESAAELVARDAYAPIIRAGFTPAGKN